jgi:hypothetical protein
MTIFKKIKEKLEKSPKIEIAEKLGYYSSNKGIEAIEKFLQYNTLTEWLSSGFYDFKFGADEFFSELCRLYGISRKSTTASLNIVKGRARCLYKCRGASIFAKIPEGEVHINSMSQAYAYAWRSSSIDPKQLIFKDIKEILDIISKRIKQHYDCAVTAKRRGADKVECYEYHHYDGTIYIFSTSGELLKRKEDNHE